MKIVLASDHRGFRLKAFIMDFLKKEGHNVIDLGTYSKDPCDYPDYVYPASLAVKENKAERAIVICYTGIGSVICANKVKGIRAALVFNRKTAYLSRRHNDSNVLVLPSFIFKREQVKKIIKIWLKEKFEGGRHRRRLKKITEIEKKEINSG